MRGDEVEREGVECRAWREWIVKPDDALLKILACPIDKGPLVLLTSEEALYNPRLRRRYPILDGIPQLLPSSGEQVSEAEHERAVRESKDRNESGSENRTENGRENGRESGSENGSETSGAIGGTIGKPDKIEDEIEEVGTAESGTEAGTEMGGAPGGATGGAAGVTGPGPERVASGSGPGAVAGS
ncbi:hypothetical protein GZL_06067 [Streptomyces sp. 769]|nr:hypothetical protein GZL_06067 [Streptomyces sp. 769]